MNMNLNLRFLPTILIREVFIPGLLLLASFLGLFYGFELFNKEVAKRVENQRTIEDAKAQIEQLKTSILERRAENSKIMELVMSNQDEVVNKAVDQSMQGIPPEWFVIDRLEIQPVENIFGQQNASDKKISTVYIECSGNYDSIVRFMVRFERLVPNTILSSMEVRYRPHKAMQDRPAPHLNAVMRYTMISQAEVTAPSTNPPPSPSFAF